MIPLSRTFERAWGRLILLGGIVASGCDGTMKPADPPGALTVVSGDRQVATAGSPLSEPFVVRVTDTAGRGMATVEVVWRVASGAGIFDSRYAANPFSSPSIRTITREGGGVEARFIPWSPGRSTVTAEVAGFPVPPVTFTIDADYPGWWPPPGSSVVYERLWSERDSIRQSRFVLQESGAFFLQFPGDDLHWGQFSMNDAGGEASIGFDGESSPCDPTVEECVWSANGELRGDSLFIDFDDAVESRWHWYGFRDGAYVRSSP